MATDIKAGSVMLELPTAIEVELRPEQGVDAAGILVALDLHHGGRYYFGTLLGLTDHAGRVRLAHEALEHAFAENQRLFPMDYRIPLEQCDPDGVVLVEGGSEFVERLALAASALVVPEALVLWQSATNERIASARTAVRLDHPDVDGVVRARLFIRSSDRRTVS